MFTSLTKKLVSATICVCVLSATTLAGDISGIVKHRRSGSPASGVRVSGLTSGMLGGMTGNVRTDDRGKFVLSWKSRSGLAKLYANGSVVARDIRDGERVVITVD